MRIPDFHLLQPEIEFATARSGGPGGQNVNKVNSKVILRLDVEASRILSEDQKAMIRQKLKQYVTSEGVLQLQAQEDRSQHQNKELVVEKFNALMTKAFTIRKKRKATKPTHSSVQKRLTEKKRTADKKKWRRGE